MGYYFIGPKNQAKFGLGPVWTRPTQIFSFIVQVKPNYYFIGQKKLGQIWPDSIWAWPLRLPKLLALHIYQDKMHKCPHVLRVCPILVMNFLFFGPKIPLTFNFVVTHAQPVKKIYNSVGN